MGLFAPEPFPKNVGAEFAEFASSAKTTNEQNWIYYYTLYSAAFFKGKNAKSHTPYAICHTLYANILRKGDESCMRLSSKCPRGFKV